MYYYGDKGIRAIVGDQSNSVPLSKMMEGESKRVVAYCDSDACKKNFKSTAKILKNVHRSTTMCPDCRCALLWKVELNYD